MKRMNGGIMYEQRDIVLMPFPYTDLSGAKQRPALIISNKKINKTGDRICCLITSQPPIEGIELTEEAFEKGDLQFQSWIKPHRLFTIHEKIINKKLCTITARFHERVARRIQEYVVKN